MEVVAPMDRQGMEGLNMIKMKIMITTKMIHLSIEVVEEDVTDLVVAVVHQTMEAPTAATMLKAEVQGTKKVPTLIKITETWKRPAVVQVVLPHHHPLLLQVRLQVQAPLDQVRHQLEDDGFGQRVLENGNGLRLALLHLEMMPQVHHHPRPTKEILIIT